MKIIFRDSNYIPDSESEDDFFTLDYSIPIIPRVGEIIEFHKSVLPDWLVSTLLTMEEIKMQSIKQVFYAEVESICHCYTKESVTIEIEIGFK